MLNDTISTKTYKLLNLVTDSVPALLHKNCVVGLERLKWMLEQDNHSSFGIYIKSGVACYVSCLDGELSKKARTGVVKMIEDTTDLEECNGYYFIHPDEDDSKLSSFSHYFMSLRS